MHSYDSRLYLWWKRSIPWLFLSWRQQSSVILLFPHVFHAASFFYLWNCIILCQNHKWSVYILYVIFFTRIICDLLSLNFFFSNSSLNQNVNNVVGIRHIIKCWNWWVISLYTLMIHTKIREIFPIFQSSVVFQFS